LKEEIYQLQRDNLELISKLQSLRNEQFVEQWDSVAQKRTFVKRLISMVELLAEAAMGMLQTSSNDFITTCTGSDKQVVDEKQCQKQFGDEISIGSFNSNSDADDKVFSKGSSSGISTQISEHPLQYEVIEEKSGDVLLEERGVTLKNDQTSVPLLTSFHSLQCMELCETGTSLDVENGEKISMDEAGSTLPTKHFHVFEDDEKDIHRSNQEKINANDEHLSKRERRMLKRIQRIERENHRKSKGSNRRLRRRKGYTSVEAAPSSSMMTSQLYLAQENKENLDLSCEQKRHRGLYSHNLRCSPVANVVKRIFSPIRSRSPMLRRESRNKRKVSYAEPSLSKKLRRGDPMTDSSLYTSPHFGYKKKSKLQQSRPPLMQIGGSIAEEK